MAEVIWSDPALYELNEIRGYIAIFDPGAANRIVDKLIKLGNSLADYPNRGRRGTSATRELVTVPPYVLQYDIVGDEITILRVRHGRRQPGG